MNLFRNRWKILIFLIITAVIIGRIFYVNRYYPQTEGRYYKEGDTIEYQNLNITCDDISVYSDQKFISYLKDSNPAFDKEAYDKAVGTQDYYVYVVKLKLTNVTGQRQNFTDSNASFCIGDSISNGSSAYITKLLSGENVKHTIEPNETKEIELAYQISRGNSVSQRKFKDLVNQKCSVSLLTFYCMHEVVVDRATGDGI